MYLAGIVFLILTKFIGTKVYGARSWLHLGPINFQPAQLAVVAGIMVLAIFLTQFREMHPMLRLLLSRSDCRSALPAHLDAADLGEVIIWVPVLLALWFVGGLPLRYLICVILIGIAFVPIAINFGLKPYQQQRITAFTHPGHRQTGFCMGNQSISHCHRLRRLVGQGIQSAKHADRTWLSARYCCAQRLHFLRHRRAMGICRRNTSASAGSPCSC